MDQIFSTFVCSHPKHTWSSAFKHTTSWALDNKLHISLVVCNFIVFWRTKPRHACFACSKFKNWLWLMYCGIHRIYTRQWTCISSTNSNGIVLSCYGSHFVFAESSCAKVYFRQKYQTDSVLKFVRIRKTFWQWGRLKTLGNRFIYLLFYWIK